MEPPAKDKKMESESTIKSIGDLRLRKFDISRLDRKPFSSDFCMILGGSGTGKTTLVKDILHTLREIPCGIVVTCSDKEYSGMVPSIFTYEEYNPMIFSNVIKRQKMVAKREEKDMEECGSTNIDPRSFLIFDDCINDPNWTRNRDARHLICNHGCWRTPMIFTMQKPMGMPLGLRGHVDFTFILRENSINNRHKLYEQWPGMFPTFDVFCQMLDQCTEDYRCLVIDNVIKSNKLEDMVFWYKANIHPEFRVCAPEYWAVDNVAGDYVGVAGVPCVPCVPCV